VLGKNEKEQENPALMNQQLTFCLKGENLYTSLRLILMEKRKLKTNLGSKRISEIILENIVFIQFSR